MALLLGSLGLAEKTTCCWQLILGSILLFPMKVSLLCIVFCLVGLNECGSNGNLALWRLLRKSGYKFLGFTEMMVFDMPFGESFFGANWRETWCQRRGDWVWIGAKQLSELEGAVTIVAVVRSSGLDQGMISVRASLCILVRCPFRETWFPSVLWPLWALLKEVKECSEGMLQAV